MEFCCGTTRRGKVLLVKPPFATNIQDVFIFTLYHDLGEVGWGDVDWIGLAKDRNRWRALVNSVLNLRVP
jgi:hypothetical protein